MAIFLKTSMARLSCAGFDSSLLINIDSCSFLSAAVSVS